MSEKRNLVHWSILALRDCKLRRVSGFSFSANITLEKGFPARCTGENGRFLFPTVPAREKGYISPFTLNTTAVPVLPKMGAKKAANLFRLTARCAAAGRRVFSFPLSVKPKFELTFYQLGFDVVLHIGIVISGLFSRIARNPCFMSSNK